MKTAAMIKERRKRTRVPVGFELSIAIGARKTKVKAVNISLTGLCCKHKPLLQVNEICRVILVLNQDTVLNIEGKVLRVGDGEAIISFLSMDEETFYHLKRLMQLNSQEPERVEKELENTAFSHRTELDPFSS
jgi:hypothetical protein